MTTSLKKKVTIIGGGISGISSAIALQLAGFDTTIYAEYLVENDNPPDARFASNFPAASVIPHSVQGERIGEFFDQSVQAFEMLYDAKFPAMERHRHYEIYEFPVDEPEYTSYLKEYATVRDIDQKMIPALQADKTLFGWAFDCYVAEFPKYIKQLYNKYKQLGGNICKQKLNPNDISELPADVIVNCAGVWSHKLFDDPADPKLIRGHMIHLLDRPKVRDEQGRICSYNYTPETDVYATPAGEPCDLYFYPIGNKWLMGGSRQVGELGEDGKWQGRESEETVSVGGQELPPQILELNKDILDHTYDISFQTNGRLKTKIGYRFVRDDEDNGLRLEKTEDYGKTVIHNYGHGGAGVTLSWGCAFEVARLASQDSAVDLEKIMEGVIS